MSQNFKARENFNYKMFTFKLLCFGNKQFLGSIEIPFINGRNLSLIPTSELNFPYS